jgi:3-hydroxymyristoyl/3-hydroxydecanoyl-(acyl carrier protein) dehydratase
MTFNPTSISERLQQIMRENAQRASTIHDDFLQAQMSSLEQTAALIELQIGAVQGIKADKNVILPQKPAALFDKNKLVEFATGSMARCFGPEFNIYEGRRHPRIPNGDLMLMDRVLEISGQRLHFDKPSSIVTEYDVPADAWYYHDNAYPTMPFSVWMEIAMQPCGFLSAYLGSNLLNPEIDFFFRNLDGNGHLPIDRDVRGKTITCKAKLLSTVNSNNTIIQKFEFELSCHGERVFSGGSIFGFFTPEAMANQVGLDGGKTALPIYEQVGHAGLTGEWIDLTGSHDYFVPKTKTPFYHLGVNYLNFLDRVFVADNAASQKKHGYIYAVKNNDPQAWFYPCHFHQDSVMPGSLGVEAMLQAMQVYALHENLGSQFKSPHFALLINKPIVWKYRGQILPTHKQMKLEINVTKVERKTDQVIIEGDASLWADTVRIYEVKHLAISLEEGS